MFRHRFTQMVDQALRKNRALQQLCLPGLHDPPAVGLLFHVYLRCRRSPAKSSTFCWLRGNMRGRRKVKKSKDPATAVKSQQYRFRLTFSNGQSVPGNNQSSGLGAVELRLASACFANMRDRLPGSYGLPDLIQRCDEHGVVRETTEKDATFTSGRAGARDSFQPPRLYKKALGARSASARKARGRKQRRASELISKWSSKTLSKAVTPSPVFLCSKFPRIGQTPPQIYG